MAGVKIKHPPDSRRAAQPAIAAEWRGHKNRVHPRPNVYKRSLGRQTPRQFPGQADSDRRVGSPHERKRCRFLSRGDLAAEAAGPPAGVADPVRLPAIPGWLQVVDQSWGFVNCSPIADLRRRQGFHTLFDDRRALFLCGGRFELSGLAGGCFLFHFMDQVVGGVCAVE
jgi:hypothetical protein